MLKKISVVAGVLENSEGAFLLSSRPEGKPYAGYWEFAGGKVEAGETAFAALQREFAEELGVEILRATPWLRRTHVYEHAAVDLRFFRVAAAGWRGELQAREGQHWAWQQAGAYTVSPMLPANAPILAALEIPSVLSGSLKAGLRGENAGGEYFVVPYGNAVPPQGRVLLDARQWGAGRQPENRSVWVSVGNRAEYLYVLSRQQDVDALVWCAADNAAAQAAAEVLGEGAPVPIIVCAPEDCVQCWETAWRDAGAQAVVCDNSIQAA
nr:NUDIX domain-containing protein [uncultured Kingella sp.]